MTGNGGDDFVARREQNPAMQAKTTPAESLPGLRRELDGLAAIAVSHFGYEERAISAALDNDVPDTGWSRPVFRLTEPQHQVPKGRRVTAPIDPDVDAQMA